MLEANKKQVPLKRLTGNKNQFCQSAQNYRPEDSVCTYSCLSNHKNWGPSPYDSLCHADNRRYFSGLPLTQNWSEAHMYYLTRKVGKFGHVLAEEKVTL